VSEFDCDVLVVGAGLAGLECARGMAARGLHVVLVDAKRSVDSAVHTTGIFVRRTLEDFDFPEGTLGPAVRHVVLYSPAGRPLMLESPREEFRVGRMGELYRHRLEEARALGVDWRPRTRYVESRGYGAGSRVLLDTEGGRREVRARFIVGADGAVSRVARDLGLDENREWIVGVEEVYRAPENDHPPAFHCWLDPRIAPGYLAWVVSDGEEIHVGVGGYADRFAPAEAMREFRGRVSAQFGLEGREPDERRGGRIPVGGVLRRIASPRGLLAGDAAGAVSPLTAGGLDPCLRLSALAVRVTTAHLAGDPAALAEYSGRRFRTKFAVRIAMRRALSAIGTPALAEAACAALRLPLFRPLAAKVFFGRGSFPDVEPASGRRPGTQAPARALRGATAN
jgi:flavin-dependent dehydrogenase